MNLLGYRAFATELVKIATEVRDPDIRAMNAEARGKEYLQGGQLPANSEFETNFKPKIASFMGYTPPSAYNFRGKKPTANSSPYETASNFAATGLKGAMTGAGAGTLLHTLRHGHDLRMAPGPLAKWVAGGAGIALADRALRRHAVLKQHKMQKQAMFSPAHQLASTQSVGTFENTLHKTPLKAPKTTIGRDFRLPPQGA